MAEHHPPEVPINGAATETLAPTTGSKRQRRPSVRLGDIGHQPAAIPHEPYVRRSKQWKIASSSDPRPPRHLSPKDSALAAGKPISKTRPLTNLRPENPREVVDIRSPPSSVDAEDRALIPVGENLEHIGAGIRKGLRDGKVRSVVERRVRSNRAPKFGEGTKGAELKSSSGEDAGENAGDEGYVEDSESLSDGHDRRAAARVRVSESRNLGSDADAMEGDVPSETDNRDWNDQNGSCHPLRYNSVRSWLNRMALGRYATLFEIHEVDDEVLPLLTLEDLKDMGINAIGSRRKMYSAIQKLKKNIT